MIKFDSILDKNYKYVKNKLIKEHETPELLLEKNQLIKQLNSNKVISKNKIFIMLVIISALIIITFFVMRRNLINKRKGRLQKKLLYFHKAAFNICCYKKRII
ncbi:hypothetical protein A8C32_12875 [Flavivirga aquatica]|uniref:Uncharacterized protein n=1 Tax=Flavivirga aquatica TaxID=1849968 RepID=A0A1E5TE15_9FLAO|nr:hypothetical protein A8C32_12875 [Flavivirga aquatica]